MKKSELQLGNIVRHITSGLEMLVLNIDLDLKDETVVTCVWIIDEDVYYSMFCDVELEYLWQDDIVFEVKVYCIAADIAKNGLYNNYNEALINTIASYHHQKALITGTLLRNGDIVRSRIGGKKMMVIGIPKDGYQKRVSCIWKHDGFFDDDELRYGVFDAFVLDKFEDDCVADDILGMLPAYLDINKFKR